MITKEQKKIFEEKIRAAESIVLMAHKNPDGDAICSVLALGRLIELNYHKHVDCVYDGNVPDNLDNVPLRKRYRFYERIEPDKPVDVAIVLDYGVARNIGGPYKFIEKAGFVIEIDHHINDDKIGHLCLDDDKAVATAEIVYCLMAECGWRRNIDIAQLLMTGLITDTGYFKYVKNGATMRIAGKLIDYGVDVQQIVNDLANKPRKTVLTEAEAASQAEFLFNNRLAIATINSRQYKNLDGRGETVLNLLGQIHGLDYIALLKEQKENQIGVSLRGRYKCVDKIATALGGGGHEYAAGAVVYDTLDNVKKKVIDLIQKEIK